MITEIRQKLLKAQAILGKNWKIQILLLWITGENSKLPKEFSESLMSLKEYLTPADLLNLKID